MKGLPALGAGRRLITRSASALALFALLPLASRGSAQAVGPDGPVGRIFVVEARARWLPERARPEFTPWVEIQPTLFTVRSAEDVPDGVGYVLAQGQMVVRLDYDAAGRLRGSESLQVRDPASPMAARAAQNPRLARSPHMAIGTDHLWPLETRVWHFTPFPEGSIAPGSERVDTLDLVAEGAPGQRRVWRGVRHSRVVGDTLVEGRPGWIVTDSTAVEVEDAWAVESYSFGSDVEMALAASGTVLRRLVVDRAVGAAATVEATAELAGTETWTLPDGRILSTPMRVQERTVAWLLTPEANQARRQQRIAEMRTEFGGMVRVPIGPIGERLAAGDTELGDSLIAAWDASRSPDERFALLRTLTGPGAGGEVVDSILFARALAAGDTAFAYRQAALAVGSPSTPLRVDQAELLVALMRDPTHALALGLDPELAYSQIRGAMQVFPPAVSSGTTRTACAPDVCAVLAAPWSESDADPRLRDLALLVRYASDPVTWYDTVVARAESGTRMAGLALRLANGGSNDTDAGAAAIPPPQAPWEAWRAWVGRGLFTNHVASARLFELRTGRDLGAEALSRFLDADSDSARVVFGTLATGLAPELLTPDRAVALLQGDSIARALGGRLADRLTHDAPAAPDAVQIEVLGRALAVLFEGAPLWDGTQPLQEQPHARRPEEIVVVSDGLPPALVDAWRDRVRFVTQAEWDAQDPRSAGWAYTLAPVRQVGELIAVDWSYRERVATEPGNAPRHYAGASRYVLLREPGGGWRVVSRSGWVT